MLTKKRAHNIYNNKKVVKMHFNDGATIASKSIQISLKNTKDQIELGKLFLSCKTRRPTKAQTQFLHIICPYAFSI